MNKKFEYTKKKWLFLDVDGVLNSNNPKDLIKMYSPDHHYYQQFFNKHKVPSPLDHIHMLSLTHLHRLNALVNKFKIENIVLSSSWRFMGVDNFKFLICCKGFYNIGKRIRYRTERLPRSITKHLNSRDERYVEVLSFCKMNNIKDDEWISLDDSLIGYTNNIIDQYDYKYGFRKCIGTQSKNNKSTKLKGYTKDMITDKNL